MVGEERQWRRDNSLAEIHLACKPEQKQLTSEAVDMTEAWEILTRRYEAPSVANLMRLEQDFATFRMGPTESVDKDITRVKAEAQELRALGVEINPAKISNTILGGLPKDYLSVIIAMTTRPGNLRVEDVIDAVLSREATLKRFETTTTPVPAPHLYHSPAVTTILHTHYIRWVHYAAIKINLALTVINMVDLQHIKDMHINIDRLHIQEPHLLGGRSDVISVANSVYPEHLLE